MGNVHHQFYSNIAIAAALLLLPATAARAQVTLAQAVAMINSNQRDEVEAGIQSFGVLGGPQAADALVQRVRGGLPPDLLDLTITTLTALGQPAAGPLLFELSAHRRPEVRLKAVEAIAA